MAITVKKEIVWQVARDNGLTFGALRDGGRELFSVDDAANSEELVNQLEDYIKNCEGSYIDIVLSDKSRSDKSKGGAVKNYQYRVRINEAGVSGVSDVGLNSTILRLLNEKHEAELRALKATFESDKKFDDLLKKIEDMKKEKEPDALERAIGMFGPMLAQHYGLSVPAASSPGLAGIEDEKEHLINLLSRWRKSDPGFIEVMEKVVLLSENNRARYDTAKAML